MKPGYCEKAVWPLISVDLSSKVTLAHHGLLRLERTERGRAQHGVAEGEKREGGLGGEEKTGLRQLLFSSPKWKLAHVTLENGAWPGHSLFSVIMN